MFLVQLIKGAVQLLKEGPAPKLPRHPFLPGGLDVESADMISSVNVTSLNLWVALLLMAEIPNNHLGCIKP